MDERSHSSSRRRFLQVLGGSTAVGIGAGEVGATEVEHKTATVSTTDGERVDSQSIDPIEHWHSGPHAQKAQNAWERIENNPLPEDQDLRNQAFIEIEEAVRDDMVLLPLYHQVTERFWYDWVDVPKIGVLGNHHQVHNETTVDNDDELNLINSTFDSLDPIESTDTGSAEVLRQLYEGLTRYPDGVAELETTLLESFDVSEDGLTWTFELKQGVEFHDGREMTADDVVYSWRRTVESEFAERRSFTLSQATGLGLAHEGPEDTGITAVDDHTVEIELRSPSPDALDILSYSSFAVLPEGLVGDIEGYDGEISHAELSEEVAIGTGPFELDFFDIDEEVRVTKYDNYHGTEPSLDSIHWTIIEDDDAIWTFVLEGNADIFGIPTAFYDRDAIDAEEDDRGRDVGRYGPSGELDQEVNYLGVPELSTFYFGMNADNVPRSVRHAVAYVLNNQEIVDVVFQGRGVPAFSFLPPGLWPTGADGYDDWLSQWPYGVNETRLDEARTVLEADGYTSDDPFEVTLTTYEDQAFQEAAETIRDLLAGSGLDISLDQAAFADLIGRGEDGDLEIYSLGWIWSWVSPPYGQFSLEPKNTDTSRMPSETTGFYLDWHTELGDEGPDGPPPIVGNNPPQDINGDGLYEDVNGDGVADIFDVQALFDNLDNDTLQSNAEFFNFAGHDPEEVTIFDVQALFNSL